MLCQFERLVYPSSPRDLNPGGYMVAVYRPCEKILDAEGGAVRQVKAVGYYLPTTDKLRYEMRGRWSKNPKFGLQFEVESYDEVIIPSKEGIVAYLSSGQIKGVGLVTAERIYNAFGEETLEVLDRDPERLLTVPGISRKKLEKICDSYLANRAARDVVAFLVPYGITANRAVQLFREYGPKTLEIVKNHPYRLSEIPGIGFRTADRIAMHLGVSPTDPERADEGLLYTLADAEAKGNLCLERHQFIAACQKLLDTPEISEEMLANRAVRLLHEGRLCLYESMVFTAKTFHQEQELARHVADQLQASQEERPMDWEEELCLEENHLSVRLAPEQRDAVKLALSHSLSIITGGPGTGKTMIQRAILEIYSRRHPENLICCCAPTGRAARRMEQSTGFPASTVHKALELIAGVDGSFNQPTPLKADLVLVDESSMLDTYLAGHLFEALKPGCRLVLIGDADQLPSVGPGAVLSELLASGLVPTVRLDRVFRQNAGSRIAINAKLIRHGSLNLEYGADFQFVDSPNIGESAEKILQIYMAEAARFGVDNVALLTPYRQKTETGVNALNARLRDMINPPGPGKREISCGKWLFREGDKIMQIRNREDVSNGDVGYIRKILTSGEETTALVDFGDGRVKEYDAADLELLDLGYASTIHKSQGSEYQSVIINLQRAHSVMLTRPLTYTAITRGKDRVILVGEKRALCMSIKKTDTEKRGTCLAKQLRRIISMKEGS